MVQGALPTQEMQTHFTELRRLLAIEKMKRPDDWQKSTAQHVTALCIDFPSQQDPVLALRDITLVVLASKKGSADAKKRALKAVRWLTETPPSLSAVAESAEEARTAIQLLQPLKAEWVVQYVSQELAANKWPAALGDLVQWLLKATGSLDVFLRALMTAPLPAEGTKGAFVASVVQSALKSATRIGVGAGSGLMAEAERSATVLIPPLRSDDVPDRKRDLRSLQAALLALTVHASATEPAVLAQGGTASVLEQLNLPKKDADAMADGLFQLLCRRFLSLASLVLQQADQQTRQHYRQIWNAYQICTPKAEQILKSAVKRVPALATLQASAEQPEQMSLGDSGPVEDSICELITNWDEYAVLHKDDPAVEQVSTRITAIAASLGIGRFGVEGQVVPYDPLRHDVMNRGAIAPPRVQVKRQGIELTRADGSSRVLLRALVQAA
jgi:hypothetical protein